MGRDYKRQNEVHSQAIRAGKRTYFFDVKKTRGDDLYLTITESKKKFNDSGKPNYEKHKVFLYKEDFEKFENGLSTALKKIQELKDSGEFPHIDTTPDDDDKEYTDVAFEDLG